ncbi:hypothetical protein FAM09_06690 [Niastella caeni]|uniref:Uncharacterized protein n=1 Tax=Niastella caeni TaxID=2569763 RepID=A0A4S8I0Y6_9BACT|nr:hypothetical protein [Niastella caeni]THU41783.1 hypothetical protein FAM09_06690 [Niastella caeni]
MKKIILFGLAVFLIAVAVSCKKKKGDDGSNSRCGETEIKVATIPATGTVDPPAPGTSFPLVVNLESIPTSGVTIKVTAKQDGASSTPFFTEERPKDKVTGSNSFTITNTPTGVTCIVEVVVTSTTCNTNQWKGSYRYSAK